MLRTMTWAAVLLFAGGVLLGARAPGRPAGSGSRSTAPETSFVQVGGGDQAAGAFVAWPAGNQAAPAIVVVHEWWGLNDQIRAVARRLSGQGYVAIVPDLYHGKVASDPMKAHELMRGLDEAEALGTLEAAAAWVRAQPRVAKSRVGTIGFCMGGGLAQHLALQDSGVAAAVMFYGSPETDPEKLAQLKGALQAHFGVEDEGIPMKRVDEFRAAFEKAGKSAEIYTYPGAGHAFMHDGLPSFRPDAARQAWARTLAFLQKHLRG
jgi:carboxymethylenebutenolidase